MMTILMHPRDDLPLQMNINYYISILISLFFYYWVTMDYPQASTCNNTEQKLIKPTTDTQQNPTLYLSYQAQLNSKDLDMEGDIKQNQRQEMNQQIVKQVQSISQAMVKGTNLITDPNKLQFQIKRAHPRNKTDHKYHTLVQQSHHALIILNNFTTQTPHTSTSAYRNTHQNPLAYPLISGIQQAEQEIMKINIQKQRLEQRPISMNKISQTVIQIRGKVNISKIVNRSSTNRQSKGNQFGWQVWTKDKIFPAQFDVVVAGKQYRLNLSFVQDSQNVDEIQNAEDYVLDTLWYYRQRVNCLRFKQSTRYYISQLYFIQLSQIYQTSSQEDIAELYYKIEQQNTRNQDPRTADNIVDRYALQKLRKQKARYNTKFEAQMRLTAEGMKKTMQLREDMGELSQFISRALMHLREISSVGEEEQMSLSLVSMRALNESLGSLDLSVVY